MLFGSAITKRERGEGERNFFKLDLLLCLYNVIVLALIHS